MRRPVVISAWVGTALVAGAAGVWAGIQVSQPTVHIVAEPQTTLYTVETGSVGKSISLPAHAAWTSTDAPPSTSSGVLTRLQLPKDGVVNQGDSIHSLDERPVTILKGKVPMYRDMIQGNRGTDVQQLQSGLNKILDLELNADGNFGVSTTLAVKKWQTVNGLKADGIVKRGDVLFIEDLPVRLTLKTDAPQVGQEVNIGDNLFTALSDIPTFTIALSTEQVGLVPRTGQAIVTWANGTWEGEIEQITSNTSGEGSLMSLKGADGTPLCGEDCATAIPGIDAYFSAELITVPLTEGAVVPVAALKTQPSGSAAVTLATGEEREVTVLASADGLACVDGLDVGTEIMLFESAS